MSAGQKPHVGGSVSKTELKYNDKTDVLLTSQVEYLNKDLKPLIDWSPALNLIQL